MRSKASYFSLSAPILKENLRRFWPIPVISFIIYFLSGPFVVLTSYGYLNSVRSYLNNSAWLQKDEKVDIDRICKVLEGKA